ncbi:MAG: HEAT repeat domain-containing protein, partial [Planctomycetales bacterium]|nr:HEAT repeat domain-containing protein [Planctomycetales bacterium]
DLRWLTVVAALLCAGAAHGADDAAVAERMAALETATGPALYAAVDGLADLGADAKPAVGALEKMLGDVDAELRWRSARALGAIGPGAAAAVPALAKRLEDENSLVRAQSAFALGGIGEASRAVAPQLVVAVTDKDLLVRRAALRALQSIKPDRSITIPLMARLLREAEPDVVVYVLNSLAEMGAEGLPALTEALKDKQGRYWALLVLAEMGAEAQSAVPAIAALVADEEPEVRMQAILALGEIGPAAKTAAPAIIKQFESDDHNAIRYAAAYALSEIGAAEAKPLLQKAVDDNAEGGDQFLRVVAAASLAALAPDDKAVEEQSVKILIAGLTSDDANVRKAAVRGLAQSKAPSELVAPAMVAAIQKADASVIGDVIANLSALGAEAVPRVKRGLANPDLRGYAAVILGNIGADAKDAVPELTAALDVEDDADFRREVLFTLGRIGPASAPAMGKIVAILGADQNERVISAACYALGAMGPLASDAAPALVEIYNNGTEFQRMLAIWALLKVRPGHESVMKRAVPLMIQGLSNERPDVRLEAIRTLGEIGPAAAEALPELTKLASGSDEATQKAAAEAIAKINKQ